MCVTFRWGIKISYYLNVQNDGYMAFVAKYSGDEFIRRQVGSEEDGKRKSGTA